MLTNTLKDFFLCRNAIDFRIEVGHLCCIADTSDLGCFQPQPRNYFLHCAFLMLIL